MSGDVRGGSVLGVDVGGTKVAVAPIGRGGDILAPALVEPTATSDEASFVAGLTETLRRAVEQFAATGPVAAGVACAGTVDSAHGVVVTSPNLPLEDTPVARSLEEALGLPLILENDANAAAWAEATAGAAKGCRHMVLLTLGTGVGGGLVLDGHLYRGAGGGAAELGHLVVCAGGEPCACGGRGCLESYASGTALERFAATRAGSPEDRDGTLSRLLSAGRLDGTAVSELAQSDHPAALAAVAELAGWLGVGLVSLANTFNPEMIVIGGGVSSLGELILEPARRILRETALAPNRDQARVVPAALGNSAGMVGGGMAAWASLAAATDVTGGGEPVI